MYVVMDSCGKLKEDTILLQIFLIFFSPPATCGICACQSSIDLTVVCYNLDDLR